VFTPAELDYLNGQTLGRFATVGPSGAPHVVPVGVFLDAGVVVIGGVAGMSTTKKFRDASRNPAVALVVDDMESAAPWNPRGIEIRGHAETFEEGGEEVGLRIGAPIRFDRAWIRLVPRRIVTWGIEGTGRTARTVA